MATGGPDIIVGTDGGDTINGLGGDDVIFGMSGQDTSPIAGRITVTRVGTGFSTAVAAVAGPGDPNHLYVLTKDDGVIHRLDPATGTSTTFLNIPDGQFLHDGERGVLSLAFHPDYAKTGDPDEGRFFVYLTNADGDIEVREYNSANGASGAPVKTIITIPHQDAANHNGGSLVFGPNDGYLYISTGDGGGGNDQFHNSQDITKLLGKILRIDVDGTPDAGKNYATPSGNPFDGATPGADEIWAFGLRNPFRISFDSNGDLYIGDVGQSTREEIDFQPANAAGGRNYGWPNVEGTVVHDTPPPNAVAPIFDYGRNLGTTVTGGVVYRGENQSLVGDYMFIDFGSNRFWTLKVVNGQATAVVDRSAQLFSPDAPVDMITSFGQDSQGNVYMVGLGGDIFRLDPADFAGDVGDALHGGPGNDRIYGGPGKDSLFGDDGNDMLSGGYQSDLLLGGPGDDTLNGGPGGDDMRGGNGNDTYIVTSMDKVTEAAGDGRDIVQTGLSYTLPAAVEILVLIGDAVANGAGNAGNNTLVGNARANHLAGNGGKDALNGAHGNDQLTGGAGPDTFLFTTALGAGNVDHIVDFAPAADSIFLKHAIFTAIGLGHLGPGAFFIGASAHDANDRIVYNPATGALIYDANGNQTGGVHVFAVIDNHAALTNADFFVI